MSFLSTDRLNSLLTRVVYITRHIGTIFNIISETIVEIRPILSNAVERTNAILSARINTETNEVIENDVNILSNNIYDNYILPIDTPKNDIV